LSGERDCHVLSGGGWLWGAAKVGPQGQPATSSPSAVPPELIQKVNDLISANKEYIALAETIQTLDDYKKNADALRGIEERSSSLVEDVMIAEAKLSATQKAEFTSQYYDSLAKPTIDEKKRHMIRVQSLLR
jgi:hypothetical protein